MNDKVEEFGEGLRELCERLHVDFNIREGVIFVFESEEYKGVPINFEMPKTESEMAREKSISGLKLIIDELREELNNEEDELKRKELEDRIDFLERNM
jgi:hypothetical protein